VLQIIFFYNFSEGLHSSLWYFARSGLIFGRAKEKIGGWMLALAVGGAICENQIKLVKICGS
jgi:hypothetical protein